MESVKLKNYQELQDYIEKFLKTSEIPGKVEIDGDFKFTIRIYGESWGKYIDWRLATFITDFQKSVNKMLKESGLEWEKEESTWVRFNIQEGSSILEVDWNSILELMASRMTDQQLFTISLTAIGVLGGLYSVKQLLEHLNKREDEKTKRELGEVIKTLLPNEKPIRKLVNKLDKKDSIQLPGSEEPCSKDRVKLKYPPKRHKGEKINVYLDGLYTIVGVKLDDGVVVVEQGIHCLKCLSSLSPEEKEELLAPVPEAYDALQGYEVNLKITALYDPVKKQITKPIIYGMGKPRKGAKDINTLLSEG